MKRFLLLALIVAVSFSCSEQAPKKDEIVKVNAEEYIKAKLGDPESYEFVSLELIDSVLYKENIAAKRDQLKRAIENGKDNSELMLEFKRDDPALYNEKDHQELAASNNRDLKTLSSIDSLAATLGDEAEQVASYTYLYKFRNINGFGAKVLNESFIQTSQAPEYKILHLAKDRERLLESPNDFPGYQEIVAKHL